MTSAFNLGIQAYRRNAERRPALDVELTGRFQGADAQRVIELIDDWLRGYDSAWVEDWKAAANRLWLNEM